MDCEKIITLSESDELIAFITQIISNQKNFSRGEVNLQSNYVPNRANNEVSLATGPAYLIDFLKDETNTAFEMCDIESAMATLNWFQKQVVELYVTHGSVKEVVSHTALSAQYVTATLNAARKKIKHVLDIR